jgi:hypothetical protein
MKAKITVCFPDGRSETAVVDYDPKTMVAGPMAIVIEGGERVETTLELQDDA